MNNTSVLIGRLQNAGFFPQGENSSNSPQNVCGKNTFALPKKQDAHQALVKEYDIGFTALATCLATVSGIIA